MGMNFQEIYLLNRGRGSVQFSPKSVYVLLARMFLVTEVRHGIICG